MKQITFIVAIVLFLSFYGCSLLEKTYSVVIFNDTLNEVTVYFDDEKPEVLHKAELWGQGVPPLMDRCYFNDVEEGDHIVIVKYEGDTYKQTVTIDKDMNLDVSELSSAPSVRHPLF